MIFKGAGFASPFFHAFLPLIFFLLHSFFLISQRKAIFATQIKILNHWKGNF
jgi:hypothetical protein